MARKPRLAVWKLASYDGCQLTLLDCEDELLQDDVAQRCLACTSCTLVCPTCFCGTNSNLWAKNGALDKLDSLLKARGKDTGALAFERNPSLNWMLSDSEIMKGKPRHADAQKAGHYIADSILVEKVAERSTRVDLNGNGKIEAEDREEDSPQVDRLARFTSPAAPSCGGRSGW